jgi:hypothetical protein
VEVSGHGGGPTTVVEAGIGAELPEAGVVHVRGCTTLARSRLVRARSRPHRLDMGHRPYLSLAGCSHPSRRWCTSSFFPSCVWMGEVLGGVGLDLVTAC